MLLEVNTSYNGSVGQSFHKLSPIIVDNTLAIAVSGRTTGFKPNTDIEKLRGFVLPMLGYLSEVLGADYVETQIQNYGTVELSPLESIRGRSFDNAIVISDESSNMTVGEIQALATRLGENTQSRFVSAINEG